MRQSARIYTGSRGGFASFRH